MPQTIQNDVLERIRYSYRQLGKVQKRIADLILSQGYQVAFMSINDLASLAETTNVTILTLAKRLGYSGYGELKKALQEHYRNKFTSHADTLRALPERKIALLEADKTLLSQAIESELELLQVTYGNLLESDLLQTVEYITTARRIYLVAAGVIKPAATMLTERLVAAGKDAAFLSINNYSMLPAIIEAVNEEDLFIIYSFPHYRMMIGGVAQVARLRGSKVITITDSKLSPVASYADIILLCKSASLLFYNSITAAISLGNVLATLVVAKTREGRNHDEEVLKVLSNYMTNAPYFSDISSLEPPM